MSFSSRPDPKKISDILTTGSLDLILKKAKILETFNTALTRHLPTSLAMHCHVMNFHNSILVIGVDNMSWLTRLRFEEQELIQKLQEDPLVPNLLGINWKAYTLIK